MIRKPSQPQGIALMLVIPAVALVTVLAYAVLANTAVQDQISANAAIIAQADCLAESGINYALYNLQNPQNAPAGGGTYWTGTNGNITLGNSPGSVSITVTSLGNNVYSVASAATVSGTSGGTISRSITVTAQAIPTFGTPNQAAGFDGPISLPAGATITVNGDLRANGAVALTGGSSVSGDIYATSLNSAGTESSFIQVAADQANMAPTAVTDFRSYSLNGVTYSATLLSTDPTAGKVLGPTATNPAGVYYAQNRTMNLNGVTINGTLIVKNGSVNVTGTAANTITPQANFPGLVVDKQVTVAGTGRQLTVNGIVWAGTGISGSGSTNSGSTITINGSLLIPATTGIGSYSGSLVLNYTAQNVAVPNFSTQLQVPKNIAVLSWSQ